MSLLVCSFVFLVIILLTLRLSSLASKRNSLQLLPVVAALCLLAGCSGGTSMTPAANVTALESGNWQISSTDARASQLAVLSGSLASSGGDITGVLHANAANGCIAPTQSIAVTGSTDPQNTVKLSGADGKGGTLTITGTLAEDGKSLTNAAYNVAGGACAFSAPVAAQAQDFSSVTGTYAGSFSDPDGQIISITANLTQTPASDASGNFQLSGTGTFPANPCFSSPVSVSNSQVTGGNFTLTYADSNTGNTVTASGTFSPDGNTLTVTHWITAGSCGPDSGTGLLTRQ